MAAPGGQTKNYVYLPEVFPLPFGHFALQNVLTNVLQRGPGIFKLFLNDFQKKKKTLRKKKQRILYVSVTRRCLIVRFSRQSMSIVFS